MTTLVYANSIPVIYGSSKTISFHKKALNQNEFNYLVIKDATEAKPKKINLINCMGRRGRTLFWEKRMRTGASTL
jgi:4-hydroxythreonine-4-phosphate dehydrogenase